MSRDMQRILRENENIRQRWKEYATELEAERDALRLDAERYQLRLETIRVLYPNAPSDIELDAAIDQAMRGETE